MKKILFGMLLTLILAGTAHAQMGFPYMYQQHADQQALGPLPDAEYDQYVADILGLANDCVQKALRINEIASTAAHRADTIGLVLNVINNLNGCSMTQIKGREFGQILELRGVPPRPPAPQQ